jgi:NADH-quinone oxidoreductase subunit J
MALFLILATVVVLGALGSVLSKNLVHCVFSLILFFFGIACFYIVLHAEFIAVVQILIYIGAVATLALFAIMLTRHVTGMELNQELGKNRWGALGVGGLILLILLSAIRKQAFPLSPVSASIPTETLGRELVTTYVLPFEVVSLLLTAAMIGAIVIAMEEAKKKRG